MELIAAGHLSKMSVLLPEVCGDDVSYQLKLGEELFDLNGYVGKSVRLKFLGQIHCSHCGRKTNKSFSQGYCYPCFD